MRVPPQMPIYWHCLVIHHLQVLHMYIVHIGSEAKVLMSCVNIHISERKLRESLSSSLHAHTHTHTHTHFMCTHTQLPQEVVVDLPEGSLGTSLYTYSSYWSNRRGRPLREDHRHGDQSTERSSPVDTRPPKVL